MLYSRHFLHLEKLLNVDAHPVGDVLLPWEVAEVAHHLAHLWVAAAVVAVVALLLHHAVDVETQVADLPSCFTQSWLPAATRAAHHPLADAHRPIARCHLPPQLRQLHQ